MEEVSFVSSKCPEINVWIVYQQLYALAVVLKDSVVKSCITFFAFKVYVIRVPHFLQYVFDVEKYSLETGKHQWSHLSFVKVLKICSALH